MFSPRSSRRRQINPVIEMLEVRRMRSADLTGVFSSSIPAALETGDKNHLAIEVMNQGDSSAAGKVTVNLFASADPSSDDDVLLGSVTRQMNLKPDRDGKVNFHFAEPATLPDGTYSLIASIDSMAVPNVTTTNDMIVSQSSVTVQQPAADLTAEMVVAPTQPIIINGDSVQGEPTSVKLVNRGNAPADGLVSVAFYLSPNSTLDSQAQLAGDLPYISIDLKPGRSEVFRTALEPAIGTPGGEYFLFADATPESGIVQKNVGDEVGLAPQQVDIIRTMPVATAEQGQPASNDYTGVPIECAVGGTGTVETPPPAASETPSTPPADCSTPACDTSSDCDSSSDCDTQPADDSDQNCDDSQTQQDDTGDQQNSTDDNSQPSTDDSQPAGDSSSDSSQQSDDNGQDDSNPPTDDSDDSDDSSDSSTDDSGDTGDSSSDDSDQSDDSGDQSDSDDDDSGDDPSMDPDRLVAPGHHAATHASSSVGISSHAKSVSTSSHSRG